MSKPDAPAPPDYRAAAIEQGQANLQAGQQTSVLSNPNIFTPYGSQQVTYGDEVMGVRQPTVTQQFSPEQQALYNQQMQLSQNLNNTAIGGLNRVNEMMSTGLDTSSFTKIPELDFRSLPSVNSYSSGGFKDFRDVDLNALRERTVDPSVGGLQIIADAIRAREAPRFQQQRQMTESDLLARGFNPGGAGYNARIDDLNRQRNDFDLGALLAAGQEQSRIANLESQFRAQGLTEQMASVEAARAIRAQQAAEEQARVQSELQARQLYGNEQLAQQQAASDVRSRQFQEALLQRQLPLNEINALRTGNQAMLPQFQQFSGASVGAAPMYGAAQDQFAAEQANYQNQMAGYNNLMGGLFGLGGATLGAAGAAEGFGNLFSFQ